jgi:outer membrane murein-binding lipoprotein Lpp
MRSVSLPFAAVLSLLFVSGCATSSQQARLAAQQAQLATEVQALQTVVENLKKDVDTVQKVTRSSYNSFASKGPTLERLAKIEMPADRSAENLKNYINEIIVASQGQNMFSPQDPQVAMLARVGADNLPLLIDALPVGSSSNMGIFYLESAIKLLADDRHKALIIKSLPIRQRLVSVVTDKGWEEDARDILISELEGYASAQLPTEWFKAVVSFEDPTTYSALTNYFSKSMSASYLYQYISLLPGIELDDAVATAWARAKAIDRTYATANMAPIAISYGHQDAADTLIELLKNPPDRMHSSVNPRLTLLMHLDTTGTNEEIIAWYEENKDSLVFDPASKKFKLKG